MYAYVRVPFYFAKKPLQSFSSLSQSLYSKCRYSQMWRVAGNHASVMSNQKARSLTLAAQIFFESVSVVVRDYGLKVRPFPSVKYGRTFSPSVLIF